MRRSIAAFVVATLAVLAAPAASNAALACDVVADPAGDVAGPLGTARPSPTAGRSIDIQQVLMQTHPAALEVRVRVADLSSRATEGTSGAVYTVFWSLDAQRYFAQAQRFGADQWIYTAGPATGLDDPIPQQGTTVAGTATRASRTVRIVVPRSAIGSPEQGAMLQQVRAGSAESNSRMSNTDNAPLLRDIWATNDRAGGPEGGRFLVDGICLPGLSGAGERCVIVDDSAADASGGVVPNAIGGTPADGLNGGTAAGAADPATEILSLQMGSNPGTIVVELGIARLEAPIPRGADAQRWEVAWLNGRRAASAFAERRREGVTFGYRIDGRTYPATGSVDREGGAIRILVPRYEVGAEGQTRLTSVFAEASLVIGAITDRRDAAPNSRSFAAQFVTGVACSEQAKAACPVVLDVTGDAGFAAASDTAVPEQQPALDLTAAGIAAPADTLVMSARVEDIGAPAPEGFERQGWTISWTHAGTRYYAQAERTPESVVFRYGSFGDATPGEGPSGPGTKGNATHGAFDVQAGVVRIVVPREAVGAPKDGALFTDVAARSWLWSKSEITEGAPAYAPTGYRVIDDTLLAPYRVGPACGA